MWIARCRPSSTSLLRAPKRIAGWNRPSAPAHRETRLRKVAVIVVCRSVRMRRGLDVVIAAVAVLLGAPLLAAIAAILRHRQGPPALFQQPRLGKGGQPFDLWKFRTMTDEQGPDGEMLPDEQRLTSLGRWLRSTSLDELPELWNVLRGNMSLVGPRPLPVAYRDRFTSTEARRMEVRPGLTGWAQIHGRNTVDWDERLAMDAWYVEHRTI